MKNKLVLLFAFCAVMTIYSTTANAQGMAVNTTGAAANASSMLDVTSTTKGILIPRMTNAQRNAISSPATGLMIFQTDGTPGFYYYDGSAWTAVGGGGSPTGSAGGGLTGTYPNPTIASGAVGIAQHSASGTASSSTFLRGDNTWATPTATPTGSAGGDLTGTYPNPTVANNAITNAKVSATAAIAYSKLNLAGSVNLASDVTGNLSVANLNSGTGASSSTFWRGDGTWATPTGGSGTVTSVSSGNLSPLFTTSVSNATTTPAINYSLSNAPAFSVLTNSTNATSTPAYGKVVPGALFATSGVASSSTFYRGDGTWQAPFTLTTTGSGAATFSSGTLNIPTPVTSSVRVWSTVGSPAGATDTYGGFTSPSFTSSPLPYAGNFNGYTVMPFSGTINAITLAGICRITGSGGNTQTIEIYKNNALVGSIAITIAGTGTLGQVVTNSTTPSIAFVTGDIFHTKHTNSNGGSGPLATIALSVQAQ